MEIEITEEKYNPLTKRKEVVGIIDHQGEKTPDRESVRSRIAAVLNTDTDKVILRKIKSQFGTSTSKFFVHVYDNADAIKDFEPLYLLKRNKLITEENGE